MADRDRLIKSCQTCLHNNVCKYTDEELCKGTKVKDLITDCKDYFANGVTVNEWISVEERLPTEDGRYLVVQNDSGRIRQNVHRFATNLKKVDKYDFYYKGDMSAGWYEYNDGEYYEIDDITHWMPLPKPPKEVDKCD